MTFIPGGCKINFSTEQAESTEKFKEIRVNSSGSFTGESRNETMGHLVKG
jgi:hypothetical protein